MQNAATVLGFVRGHEVIVAVALIAFLTAMNLRGVRESGKAFAVPVYAFMLAIIGMGIYGFIQHFTGTLTPAESAGLTLKPEEGQGLTGLAAAFLLLRAFSSGCAALTGVEAISNGVPAFKKPKSNNAATTLLLMGTLSIVMLGSIIALSQWTGVKIADDPGAQLLRDGQPVGDSYVQHTAIGQLAESVFADFHLGVVFVSIVTGLILVLAANTAFNGFPVLGSILARDGYLPRQMHTRGDRLAFSNGILILAGAAIAARHRLQGRGHRADPALHRRGVRLLHHLPGRHGAALDAPPQARAQRQGAGADAALARHQRRRCRDVGDGAHRRAPHEVPGGREVRRSSRWSSSSLLMLGIKKHYNRVRDELAIDWEVDRPMLPSHVHAIVCISKVHKPTMRALAYARASRPTYLEAVTVDVDPDETQALLDEWDKRDIPVPLKVLSSPYRQITKPILDYVRSIRSGNPRDIVTVYLPEYVLGKWWEQVLHNQSALRLKARLLFTPGVMVVSVPWQLAVVRGRRARLDRRAADPRVRARRGAVSRRQTRERAAGRRVARRPGVDRRRRARRPRRSLRGPARGPGRLRAPHAARRARRRARHRGAGRRLASCAPTPSTVLEAAPGRVEAPARMPLPACCGGCDFQHASLDTQRALKAAVVREQFARARRSRRRRRGRGRCPATRTGCGGAPASSSPSTTSGGPGLRAHRSRDDRARSTTASSPRAGSSTPGVLDTDWPDVESVDVVDAAHPEEPVLVPLPVARGSDAAGGLVGELARDGDWEGEYVVAARGFWQVHPGAASTFLGRVVALLGARPGDLVADLYAGSGLFTMRLAELVAPDGSVLGVEGDARAVENGIRQHRAPRGRRVAGQPGRPRAALARVAGGDAPTSSCSTRRAPGPARTSCGSSRELAPRRVVYVACDPAALARDVKAARETGLRHGLARGLGRLPDDPPRRVHRGAGATRRVDATSGLTAGRSPPWAGSSSSSTGHRRGPWAPHAHGRAGVRGAAPCGARGARRGASRPGRPC